LLSSLPGVAVTRVKIDGVLHEISTIPGVKEDVTEIILNIKGITAKLHSPVMKTAIIDVHGECEVTAGDIVCDSELEIINPDHHIATLSSSANLYMELVFDRSELGFSPYNSIGDYLIGDIPLACDIMPGGTYALNIKTGELKAIPELN
jgi:DNA-directed RNA polymerase alpha subunit